MKAAYKNIGLIAEAEIDLNGITVIAAPNNSGKSFLAKGFYMFLETLIDFKKEYFNFRNDILVKKLNQFFRLLNRALTPEDRENFIDYFENRNGDSNFEEFLSLGFDAESETIEHRFSFRLLEARESDEGDLRKVIELLGELSQDFLQDTAPLALIKEILSYFEYLDDKKLQLVLESKIEAYFGNDLLSHESEGTARFGLLDNGSLFENLTILDIEFNLDTVVRIESQPSLNEFTKILYLDSFINLEDYNSSRHFRYPRFLRRTKNDIRTRTDEIFSDLIEFEEDINPFRDDISLQNKLFSEINRIIGGNIEKNGRDIIFSKDGYNYSLKNTATGVKIFGVLQLLLKKYQLTPDLFMIIDEPETNLHPVWQVKLAEIIVLLNKELGVQFMINSHSSNFIEGIKLYSELYECEQATSFYLINTEQYGRHIVENVSHNIQLAYDQLNGSLDILDEVAERILVKSQGES